jgi:membrane fusion protein (multidrug efflux system)
VEVYQGKEGLMLPFSALMNENDSTYVVIYDNGKARFKQIKTGEKNRTHFEVLEGLTGDEQVIIEGNYDLKNNAPVKLRLNKND